MSDTKPNKPKRRAPKPDPGKSQTAPGKSQTAPGKQTRTPDKAKGAPGKSSAASGKSSAASGKQKRAPDGHSVSSDRTKGRNCTPPEVGEEAYYREDDYQRTKPMLDEKIEEIHHTFMETLEPTLDERNRVRKLIFQFITERKLIIYGGTAMNDAIKAKDPTQAFYDRYTFGDVEAYSTNAYHDTMDLADRIQKAGFQDVFAKLAVHDGTYTIFANGVGYCDFTYVPPVVYRKVACFSLGGLRYVHPHFALIDQLRIINQPLTTGSFRWCKVWNRMFRILRLYPLPTAKLTDRSTIPSDPTLKRKKATMDLVLELASEPHMRNNVIIGGIHAYNMYLSAALVLAKMDHLAEFIASSTFQPRIVELFAVRYELVCTELFEFLYDKVPEPDKLSVMEHFPFFQFVEKSITIYYDTYPIVKVVSQDDYCVPTAPSTQGARYITYQYLLCTLMIEQFRSQVTKDQDRCTETAFCLKRLVAVRNEYYRITNDPLINDGPFTEFVANCVGETMDFLRANRLKKPDYRKPMAAKYCPAILTPEKRQELRAKDALYPFINGAEIIKGKYRTFRRDDQGLLVSGNLSADLTDDPSD